MHPEALDFIRRQTYGVTYGRVLEFGSLNINGTTRDVITAISYYGIDRQKGPGVDEVVQSAAVYRSLARVDLVVCCEVLEHTPELYGICSSAFDNLRPGGVFLVTCATRARQPHSAVDGGPLRNGEYYHNVSEKELKLACRSAGFVVEEAHTFNARGDLYLRARKP